MKSKSIGILFAAFTTLGTSSLTAAAKTEKIDLGKQEYLNKCAVCHGKSGKGNDVGPILDVLKKAPSDLTLLSKNNGGVFPFDRVYGVIDGRETIAAHGEREMPIWGNSYSIETVSAAEHYFDVPYDMQMYVRARILALIDYLNRIQSR